MYNITLLHRTPLSLSTLLSVLQIPRWQNGKFNLLISYHRASDVLRPYGITLRKITNRVNTAYYDQDVVNQIHDRWDATSHSCENSIMNKTRDVLMIVSHCDAQPRAR